MSDDVKAAIADALDERWPDWRFRSDARTVDVAEVALGAAVEAGMAPAAEVERLETELFDVHYVTIPRLREEVARLHEERRSKERQIVSIYEGVERVREARDRYRGALERIRDVPASSHCCDVFQDFARAALDGDE